MRTAVVRVNIDPEGALAPVRLDQGMRALLGLADESGASVVNDDLTAMPADRRVVQLLIDADDIESARGPAVDLCRRAFGTESTAGVVTFVSRGTDDDARGVLAGFGLNGEIARAAGDDGYDVVSVTLCEADLDRVPESRVHTALEAALNCEVRIESR